MRISDWSSDVCSSDLTDHPCQFPVGLVERLVLSMTNPGGNVLDPYLGVGSSAVAALKNGRNAYGCDITEEYVEVALDRIAQLEAGTLRTRAMNKPIYEPPMREDLCNLLKLILPTDQKSGA